jgi:protein SCO1/2
MTLRVLVRKPRLLVSLMIAVLVGLVAGLWTQYQDREVTNPYATVGGNFTLVSKDGEVSLADFKGKVVLLFFGYTFCPDVCPTELAKMRVAFNDLSSSEIEQVVGIFVSVDTNRDTPEKASAYAAFFHDKIVGLTGTGEQVSEVAKLYFVGYRKVEAGGSAAGYTVDHTATTYLIGRDGKVQKLLQGLTSQEIVQELRNQLAS